MVEFISDAYPPNPEALLNTYIKCIENKLAECRIKDLEKISCHLVRLNYQKGTYESFVENLMTSVVTRDWIKHRYFGYKLNHFGRSFVFFNTFMATVGHYRSDFLRDIFETVNSSAELKEAHNLDDIIKGGIITLSRIGPKYGVEDYQAQWKKEALTLNDYQGALASLAQLDCLMEINFPEYQDIRLDINIKRKLLSLERREPEHAREFEKTNNILHDLCRVMNIRVQDESKYVYHGFLSPDARNRDIVFCVDLQSSKCNDIKLVPFSRQYENDLIEGINIVRPQKYVILNDEGKLNTMGGNSGNPKEQMYKWFAVVIPPRKYCHSQVQVSEFGTKIIGPLKLKIVRLERLGYHVITIPYELVEKHDYKKRMKQIRKLLNEQCIM